MRNLFYYLYSIIFILYICSFSKDKTIRIKRENVSSNIIAFILIVLMGLRRSDIGIDTFVYADNYVLSSYSDSVESGYQLIASLFRKYDFPFMILLLLEAIIYILPINYFIKKYSKNVFLSYFLFISFDFYFIGMTALRQTIAMGISFCILILLLNRKFSPVSLLLIPIPYIFHRTAIIITSYFFFPLLKNKKIFFILYLSFFIVVSILFNYIQTMLLSFGRIEYHELTTGGLGMFYFFVLITVLALIYLDSNDIPNSVFTNMMLLTLVLYSLLRFNPSLLRLHYYFSISQIILIPCILFNIKNLFIKIPIFFFCVSIALYYATNYAYLNYDVIPYYFCWETAPRISIYWLIH